MQNSLWFSWRELPLIARFFLLVLASASIYVVLSASIVLRRVHSLTSRQLNDVSGYPRSIQALQARCMNMGQLIGSTFFFFGFVFFILLPEATRIFGDRTTPVITLIFENFGKDFAYAADVFCVLFILSLIHWFASARVRGCSLRLDIGS